MQHLDLQVIEQALKWSLGGRCIWLCTVLNTFGSSPRAPGAMMVALDDGTHLGSLSGGCVEEDFLARLQQGEFNGLTTQVRYGVEGDRENPKITLPCGGQLDVLVECLASDLANQQHLEELHRILIGQTPNIRLVDQLNQTRTLVADNGQGAKIEIDQSNQQIRIRLGPVARLIIVGNSAVTPFCAQFAQMLGFEVIVCFQENSLVTDLNIPNVRVESVFPADFIHQPNNVHSNTAIVALTHDPRIDDLAMIDAVNSPAFYFGVMGSMRTSNNRAERLKRVGGLNDEQIERIHMPIGLNLRSKTPAEIALAVMADILRVQRGVARDAL